MVLDFLFFIAGLVLLVLAGNWLIDGASNIARYLRMPELIVGLTIVAFGTSAPELMVNIFSAVGGYTDMGLANVVGSNTINLFAVLGLSGLVAPLTVSRKMVLRDIPMSVLFSVLLLLLATDFFMGEKLTYLSVFDSCLMIAVLLAYYYVLYRDSKKEMAGEDGITPPDMSLLKSVVYMLIGLGGLVGGAKILVFGATNIASALGVSEKIIGMTIVAFGTSLPELVTSIVGCYKGNVELAVGNIVGSNVMNIGLVLGLSNMIEPTLYDPVFTRDIIFLLLGTVALFVYVSPRFYSPYKLDRVEASTLFIAYVCYTVYMIME